MFGRMCVYRRVSAVIPSGLAPEEVGVLGVRSAWRAGLHSGHSRPPWKAALQAMREIPSQSPMFQNSLFMNRL